MKTAEIQKGPIQNQSASIQKSGGLSVKPPKNAFATQLAAMEDSELQAPMQKKLMAGNTTSPNTVDLTTVPTLAERSRSQPPASTPLSEQLKTTVLTTSPAMMVQRKMVESINSNPRMTAQRQRLESLTGTAQRVEEEEPLQGKFTSESPAQLEQAPSPKPNASTQLSTNNTGLPDNLKSGIENLSGMSMDNVKVHYNSSQPAQLNALAYAQGSDIHIAPGQEQHLPHEAWHVVQQAQGRVKPTLQAKGTPINDEQGLEHEADLMGGRAMQMMLGQNTRPATTPLTLQAKVIQRYSPVGGETRYSENHLFMLLNSKSLWARQGAIDESNQELEKKNSFVRLAKTGLNFVSGFGPTMHELKPAWNNLRAHNIAETRRLGVANQGGGAYTTHADCFMNAQTVMGVEDTATGSLNTTAPIFEHDGGHSQMAPVKPFPAGPGSALSSNAPTRGYLAFLNHAIPAFYANVKGKPEKTPAETDFINKCKRESQAGFLFVYRQLATNPLYATLFDTFSRMFKINEYMTPEIGEGLAVINQPMERNEMQVKIEKGEADQKDELWNYHFAGVVMKDATDYVTLENYSVGNDAVDNQNWIFQMYGTGEQSFHREMKGKHGIGQSPLSLGFIAADEKKGE